MSRWQIFAKQVRFSRRAPHVKLVVFEGPEGDCDIQIAVPSGSISERVQQNRERSSRSSDEQRPPGEKSFWERFRAEEPVAYWTLQFLLIIIIKVVMVLSSLKDRTINGLCKVIQGIRKVIQSLKRLLCCCC